MAITDMENAPATVKGDKLDREKEILLAAAPILLCALQPAYRSILRAFLECSDTLQYHATKLLATLNDPQIDDDDRFAAAAVLADILFPNPAEDGYIGIDLKECESQGASVVPETRDTLTDMDEEEKTFSERLTRMMGEKKITQEALAAKIGVGQPAISMMLNRDCRPQRKTVFRLAEALEVSPDDLWPGIRK